MTRTHVFVLASAVLLAAIAAWIGTVSFALMMRADLEAKRAEVSGVELAEAKANASVRVRALARDTEFLRRDLAAIADVDILKAADTIERLGPAAGVKLKIGSAVPEIAETAGEETVLGPKVINFLIEAEGKFHSLMHAAALLEALPFASEVVNLELQRIGDAKSDKWQLIARIRFLTSADIQS